MFGLTVDPNITFNFFNLALSFMHTLIGLFVLFYSFYYNSSLPSIILFVEGGNGLHFLHRFFLPFFFILGLTVSAIFYLFYGLGEKFTDIYTLEIMSKKQRFRWIEFALSGSSIMITTAFLLGIHSLTTILGLVIAVLAIAFLGFSHMRVGRNSWSLVPLMMGVIFFTYIFLTLYWGYRALRNRNGAAGTPSGILYFLISVLIYYGAVTAFSLFPMVWTRDEKDYEYIYGIGSFFLRCFMSAFLCYSIYN